MVKVRVAVVASYRRYRSSHWLYDNPQHFDQNILYTGTLASDVFEADRAGVP